jgi:hypothetical protein
MFRSWNELGSLVLDVDGNVLHGTFLQANGSESDRFSIVHGAGPTCSTETLVPVGATWRYLDDGTDQGSAWRSPAFDDATWASGPAELGFGDGDEATVVAAGSNTVYFRHTFQVADAASVGALDLGLLRDDGAVVYLNGAEVLRSNMPAGPIGFATPATSQVAGSGETTFVHSVLPASSLVEGTNVLAVEVHQVNPTSSDISFDLELRGAVCSRSSCSTPRGSSWGRRRHRPTAPTPSRISPRGSTPCASPWRRA